MRIETLDREALQRRSLRILIFSQVLGGAGLAAGVTVGALLAEDMIGSTRFAGLPAALFTIGSAATAFLVGVLSDRGGRRVGLAVGYFAGAAGGLGITVAAIIDDVPLLLVSLFVYGAGTATNLQARYAGGDLASPERRGAAVSTVLVATTLGAVAGPNLVGPIGSFVEPYGIPPLAGPFALAAIAYSLAAVVLMIWLHPDPLLTARAWGREDAAASQTVAEPGVIDVVAVRLGALAMVTAQLVMIAVMTMTPVHMRDHGHGLGATGLVIGLHVAAMFLPSPLTGRLADRYGSMKIVGAGGVSLVGAGIVAAAAPTDSAPLLAIALILLGLGWNLGLLGGTTLISKAVPLEGRARVQGRVDVAVAIAGATGGLSSGVIVAATSYPALALLGAVVSVLALGPAMGPMRSATTRLAHAAR